MSTIEQRGLGSHFQAEACVAEVPLASPELTGTSTTGIFDRIVRPLARLLHGSPAEVKISEPVHYDGLGGRDVLDTNTIFAKRK